MLEVPRLVNLYLFSLWTSEARNSQVLKDVTDSGFLSSGLYGFRGMSRSPLEASENQPVIFPILEYKQMK